MSGNRTGERLPLGWKIWYGAPAFAGAAMGIPIGIHMPRFYSDEVLAPLGYIAVAMAVARALDALTDPVVGWLSDRTRTRWGRRLPWIALAAPLSALAFLALFSPPEGLGRSGGALWFSAAFSLYYLFATMVSIPHSALGAELSLDYRERTSLFGYQSFFSTLGVLVGVMLPYLLQLEGDGGVRQAYRTMGLLYGAVLIALYVPFLITLRERPRFRERGGNPLVPGVRRALRNRPFKILLVASILYAIPAAIPGIMTPFHTYYVLQPDDPERWMTAFLLAYFATGFVCLPGWVYLAQRIGKITAYLIAAFVGATSNLLYFFPGPGDVVPTLLINLYSGIQSAAFFALVPAMSADVIDYDELRTGRRREGQLSAFWAIIPKFVAIPSASIPLAVLASVGYTPNVAQTPDVIFAIRFIYGIFPTAFFAAGMVVMFWYPITRAVHEQIREGIDARAAGRPFADPLTGPVPAGSSDLDEATAWRLDYFSRRELVRLLDGGPARVVASVCGWLGVSVAAVLATGALAARSVADPDVESGIASVLWIVAAGFSVTAAAFHAGRLPAALRLRSAPESREAVASHLGTRSDAS